MTVVIPGYFRARISSLSPFDKIVGGMAWAVTAANEEVEIEYDENAKIGQKMYVSNVILCSNCHFYLILVLFLSS